VRDLSFFEKQKQRIERFDKMILSYVSAKEHELIFENAYYRSNSEQIKMLLSLEQYFGNEQGLIEQLIDQKLVKDFDFTLNNKIDGD
jgi:hypothetical protein